MGKGIGAKECRAGEWGAKEWGNGRVFRQTSSYSLAQHSLATPTRPWPPARPQNSSQTPREIRPVPFICPSGSDGQRNRERTGVPTSFFLFPCPTFPCPSYATLAAGILPVGAAFRTMSKNTNLFCSEGGPMKSYRETLTFNVPKRMDFVNITPQVEAAVAKSGVREGLVLVNAMHITASVFINDDEPGLHEDYKRWLEELAPFDPSPETLPPQPHRRGQRRRPPQAADHGPRSRRGDHRRQARLRPVGTDLLRRVRRPPAETGAGQDHWRVSCSSGLQSVWNQVIIRPRRRCSACVTALGNCSRFLQILADNAMTPNYTSRLGSLPDPCPARLRNARCRLADVPGRRGAERLFARTAAGPIGVALDASRPTTSSRVAELDADHLRLRPASRSS